jgi:hypothetical protein
MDDYRSHFETLLKLEEQHEDLLCRLDALDKQVEQVLRECQPGRAEGEPVCDL